MADSITLRDYLPEMFGYTNINLSSPPVLTQTQLVQLEAAKATGIPGPQQSLFIVGVANDDDVRRFAT